MITFENVQMFKCMIFGFVIFDRGEFCDVQKQPPRGVPRKSCSENMEQIYRRAPMPKCDRRCSPVNLLQIFRTTFPRITSGWLLLDITEFTPIKFDESENHAFEIALYWNRTSAWVFSNKFAANFQNSFS